ncbi:leucine-rich repeat domain-containing protein [Oribacterium sp. FC2011]|uniref:leucine-rich repeat domain-containing protein n=1 Tax=Oribacterium sp. FC2011 TaxID=1408311 RepID=UPI0004E25061|nr:leucine-rich repeat domain-containing protein [Oribacterium sp. FC2011]
MNNDNEYNQSINNLVHHLNVIAHKKLLKPRIEASFKSLTSNIQNSTYDAFSNEDWDEYILDNFELERKLGGYCISKYIGFDENIIIPAYFDGEPIISIGHNAFYKLKTAKKVIIGNDIIAIDDSAFQGCSSLKNIILPNSLIFIGNSSFYGCSSLERINLPDGIRYIGEACFSDCGIKELTLPNSLKYIDSYAFSNTNIEELYLPYGVEFLGYKAFYNCKYLRNVELPCTLQIISEAAFLDCANISEIDIPSSVSEIGDDNFKYSYIVQPDKRYNPRIFTASSNTVISCSPGSCAQEYARKNDLSLYKSKKQYIHKDTTQYTPMYLFSRTTCFLDTAYHIHIPTLLSDYCINIIYYDDNEDTFILNIKKDIYAKYGRTNLYSSDIANLKHVL